jgi:hypothetical protein
MYYRLLNCGFRIAATSGSDNFSDAWRDPPPGADRAYVHVTGRLSLQSWIQGIKAGRTFGTAGPLLFLTVNGKEPGEEIALSGAGASVSVKAESYSIAPLEKLEIIVNGKVVATSPGSENPARSKQSSGPAIVFSGDVPVPDGGWVAARVVGPASRYVSDSYAFAQTSPVYVVCDGKRFTSAVDADFLARVVDAVWQRIESRSPWRSAAEKEKFRAAVEQARSVYRRIADGTR